MPDHQPYDCLIVGAGPAGLVAGIYLRRFHRRICIVDAGASRALRIPKTHNYPGFPDGVVGVELLQRLREQLDGCGGAVEPRRIEQLQAPGEDGCFVARSAGRDIRSRTVLLATGVEDIEPELQGIEAVRGRGLLRYCPICDGTEFTGRRIGVLGSGAHGVREAVFIRNYSAEVSLLCLSPQDEPDEAGRRQLRENQVKLACGPFAKVADTIEGAATVFAADGGAFAFDVLYAALGTRVRAELAAQVGAARDAAGCLTVDRHQCTSVAGLYAAGDVVSSLDQLVVAGGQAAIAASAIHNSLPAGRPAD
ncbi:NAD(P)/FAD-dependent oxidoreductase [Aquabacterium sp. A7-Y]|uniref:NAD(P)/FAD-dependent oxidoreductase n=1 Tax=Aquabacterium sp. A7-Y TaxID=1349605 RepID=UPI00223E2AAB|nr:NAD(P)/FAD-dependent oxidoreductase [Aquabacterium sp. A7-Y]MCW7540817.1 NAD(P)/FAD-dependent oxidoreductase [Aquabacterium sp. A7-Y]